MEQTKKLNVNFEAKIKEIFTKVLNNFTYVSDANQYGILERWIAPADDYDGSQHLKGDCEDFALALRKLLNDSGITTRLLVCRTETNEQHCVVVASEEDKSFILDNRFSCIQTKSDLSNRGYTWIKISDTNQSNCKWFKVT